MGDIGEPIRKVEFLPEQEPATEPLPVEAPERERVPA